MEHGVHIPLFIDTVEYGACNITDALGDNPPDGSSGYRVDKWLEGYEYRQSHAYEANRFQVAVVFEFGKAHHRACNGTSPDKDEETPSPITLVAKGDEGDRRVGTSDVPVDGGVVPLAQSLLPLAPCREGVVGGGGDV